MGVFSFQVHIFSYIFSRVSYQSNRQRIHTEQLHLPSKPVELVRFHRDSLRLPHFVHRDGQPCRLKDFQSAQGPQNRRHTAK